MSIEQVLDQLDRYKATGKDQWHAPCPAHDDRTPSLSIRVEPDGRVLLHCHAGCGAIDVLNAIGLDFGALYPPDDHYRARRRKPSGPDFNELVIATGRAAIRAGKYLTASDKQTMRTAFLSLGGSHVN